MKTGRINLTEKNKGIICILLAAFGFSLMSIFIKLSGDLPTMQKAVFRNAVAIVIAGVMLIRNRGSAELRITRDNIGDLLRRSIFGSVGIVCNFYAISHMNMADANLLNKLSPFFAILMSIFVLKERASFKEWLAVFIAFAGALCVIKPGSGLDSVPALVGLTGGICAGIAYTYLRRLGKNGTKGPVIVFFFAVISTLVCLPGCIIQYQHMTVWQTFCLIMVGVCASASQFAITAAYTHAPAKEISIFDYTQIIFAAMWGFLIFGEVPDVLSLVGYVVIFGASLVKFLSAQKRAD